MSFKANWKCVDIEQINYVRALDIQRKLVEAKKNAQVDEDILLVLEHAAVFTVGRNGGYENLIVSKQELDRKGIEVVHIERGGNITYHGPGQLVAYPIIDLRSNKLSVTQFVYYLEEVMLQICESWGVKADRDQRNHGLWVGEKKIGSVGVAIRKGISFHGLAFNVCNSLTPFSWINPCGLNGVQMTSLQKETSAENKQIAMDKVRQKCKEKFSQCFEIQLEDCALDWVEKQLT
jgi:lipoate-protein ligase B